MDATATRSSSWRSKWLRPRLGTTTPAGRTPEAYLIALHHVAATLDADPAWHRWWLQSGVPACELGVVTEGRLDHLRPSADIRRADHQIRANFTCAVPLTDRRPADLLPLAAAEMAGMFEVIREAIGLPPLPAPPHLPELPPGPHEVEVISRPRPAITREPQQRSLPLAQIHEFFG